MPGLGIALSKTFNPLSKRFTPPDFSATNADDPKNSPLFNATAQPELACKGEISVDNSCPCKE